MFDPEAVYWTLSTIAQTLVALVAFIGFVAVWRLQTLEGEREGARRRLLTLRIDHSTSRRPNRTSDEELVAIDLQWLEDEGLIDGAFHTQCDSDQELLAECSGRIPKVRAALRRLAYFGIAATGLALLLLAFTPRLVGTEHVAGDLEELAVLAFAFLALLVAASFRYAFDVLAHILGTQAD